MTDPDPFFARFEAEMRAYFQGQLAARQRADRQESLFAWLFGLIWIVIFGWAFAHFAL